MCPRRNERSAEEAPRDTAELILEGARRVLVAHGHADFTTRRVAQEVGISLGNLTYHFPTKRELLQALIARMVASYSGQFETLLSAPELSCGDDLEPLVRWLLVDSTSAETVRLFRELWALALHDELIRAAVDDLYDDLIALVVKLVHRSRPRASLAAVRELVHVLAMISEGSTVIYGLRPGRKVSLERAIGLVARLLDSAAPASPPQGRPGRQGRAGR